MGWNVIKKFASKNKFYEYFVSLCFLIYSLGISLLCLCMRCFPVQENKVVCCTAKGKRYGDNPMYITDELLKRNSNYKIVWLLAGNVDEKIPEKIKRVKNSTLAQIYELMTAAIWIDSNTKMYGILKRKNQLYIQTWHGSYGLKKMYGDAPDKFSFIDKTIIGYNSRIADIYVSNSKMLTQIFRRAFWYQGKILECGSPRNDIFWVDNAPYIEKVRKHFGIEQKKILLYAPTFRKNYNTDIYRMDYHKLAKAVEKRFGGEWVILIRLHPNNMEDASNFLEYDEVVMNATEYSVMQELLVASDILVTDYSSCMFDFVTKKKKCFLYAPDIEQYKKERDVYFELHELPFPYAENDEQLEKVILEFEQLKYEKELEKLFMRVGLRETGYASKIVADYIEEWMASN